MNNPAFIVEGETEKKIIQYFCPDMPIRVLGCNGKDVSYEAAGKRMATLIRMLDKNYPIIILFDKEIRTDTSEMVREKLLKAIKSNDIRKVDIHIGIPDRMIENWLLADVAAINAYYKVSLPQKDYEGKGGYGQIKDAIGQQRYHKTYDGPEIAKKCKVHTMYNTSKSFKDFHEQVAYLDCPKLKIKEDIL